MAKAKKSDFENPDPILEDQDEETLAAIDKGLRDAAQGQTVSAKEVRQRLPQWIPNSSTRKES
jgi:predicted transcriptional regulator